MKRKLIQAAVATTVASLTLFAQPRESQAIFHWLFGNKCNTCAAPAPVAPVTASYCGQTCNYVPTTAYRVQSVSVPVTTYQPMTTADPCGGCPVTAMRPVTTMVQQTRMVPYTSYKLVYSNPCTTCAAPVAPACSTCGAAPATSYYAPTAYQQTAAYVPGAYAPPVGYAPPAAAYAPAQYAPAPYAPVQPAAPACCGATANYSSSYPSAYPSVPAGYAAPIGGATYPAPGYPTAEYPASAYGTAPAPGPAQTYAAPAGTPTLAPGSSVYGSPSGAPASPPAGNDSGTQLNAPANAPTDPSPHPTFESGSSSESRLKPIPDAGVNAPPPEPTPAAVPARQRSTDSSGRMTLLQVQNSWQYTPATYTQVAERPARAVQSPSWSAIAAPAAPAPAAPQPTAADSAWRPSSR